MSRQYTNAAIIMKENYTQDLVNLLFDSVLAAPSKLDTIVFHEGGGAVARVPVDATAFPWRNCFIVIQVNAIWTDAKEDAVNVQWVDQLMAALANYSSGSYVNYMNGKMKGYNEKYYGSNLPRLQKTKDHFDPDNFFRFPAGIDATVSADIDASTKAASIRRVRGVVPCEGPLCDTK